MWSKKSWTYNFFEICNKSNSKLIDTNMLYHYRSIFCYNVIAPAQWNIALGVTIPTNGLQRHVLYFIRSSLSKYQYSSLTNGFVWVTLHKPPKQSTTKAKGMSPSWILQRQWIILVMGSANEKRRYNVTSSLIDWAHILNDLWRLLSSCLICTSSHCNSIEIENQSSWSSCTIQWRHN